MVSGKEHEKSSFANTSLLRILQHLESTPDLTSYGLIGVRQYSANCSVTMEQGSFSHCPVHSCVMMNLALLEQVQYDKERYSHEELDFSVRVFASGTLTCRFNHLVVAKKVIEMGGHTSFKVLSTNKDVDQDKHFDPVDRLVIAPDREDAPYLPVPAHYLLELYLAQAGAVKLFPEAADKPDLPVLVVNCYVNLGPKVWVEFVSSSPEEKERMNVMQQTSKQDTRCDR